MGNYDSASFSSIGYGRFRPLEGSDPAIGKIGEIESVVEERIETEVTHENLPTALDAVREVHPYECPAIHVSPLIDYRTFLSPRAVESVFSVAVEGPDIDQRSTISSNLSRKINAQHLKDCPVIDIAVIQYNARLNLIF